MKLFVDDIRAPWPGWELTRTVTEAIRLLASGFVTEISLDHDIACRLVQGHEHTSNETYAAIAYYLKSMDRLDRPVVRFHTGNPVGGRHMADILGMDYDKARVDYDTFEKETL